MSVVVTYHMPHGLGTYFTEFDRPISFASLYTNRYRNINGGSARRPGMSVYGSAAVAGKPNLTRLHEFVSDTGSETLFSSDDSGNIYKFSASAWSTSLTGKSDARMISVEADGKLIVVNGVDRNFYTDDGGDTWRDLKALITTGTLAGGSNTTTLVDGNISNWVNNTLVSNNDIVHNVTRGGYAIVSTVASASLTHTTIGTGGNGAGKTTANQTTGDIYELEDYVDMPVILQPTGEYDNIAVLTTGTTSTVIAVSGVDFSTTEIRENDFVYNTTRGAIAHVGSVSAKVNLKETITGQISGDSIALFKSAMPIASWVHVHYGRVYYLDSRNQRRVVISAPDDPQDVTTYQETLDGTSFNFGSLSPAGDAILSMNTFLSYFVAAGKKNLYIYQGNTPISDNSGTTINFTAIATYPNGVASRFGLATNGGELLNITTDGLQSVSIGYNAYSMNQNNISMPIFNDFRAAIANTTDKDNIQTSYYPRRRWLINKIGDNCYVLNTNPSYQADGTMQQLQSWHLFTGLWAQQNHYFVRRNGDLLSCGPNGKVYYMDNGDYTDCGDPIATDLETAWLRLEEPQITPRIKEGHYIRPVFESSPDLEYTISVRAGLDSYSSDSITVSAGYTGAIGSAIVGTTPIGAGTFAQTEKHPLRWRGEQAKIKFTTKSSASEDVITAFSLYGNIAGRR